jgi:hypothetical protein
MFFRRQRLADTLQTRLLRRSLTVDLEGTESSVPEVLQ